MNSAVPVAPVERGWSRWVPPVFLLVCALVFLRVSVIGWDGPILGPAAFRQTQTAIAVDHMLRDGVTLDYETPVLGAPWQLPFEFPTYQWIVVVLVKLTGLGLEPAGRLVSLGFAGGAFALLGRFVRRGTGSAAAGWFASALALTMPLYLFYSRAFLIASTALCLALAFLVAVQSFVQAPRRVALAAVFITGLLTKPGDGSAFDWAVWRDVRLE